MNFRLNGILGLALLALIFGACAKPSSPDAPPPENPRVLVKSDIKSFAALDSVTLQEYDNEHGHLFSAIFGGPSGAEVKNYLSARIHYFLATQDVLGVTPEKFQNEGWSSHDHEDHKDEIPKVKGEVSASNIGVAFWLQGLLDKTTFVFRLTTHDVPVTSSRTGVMLFGSGYRSVIHIPASIRHPEGYDLVLPPEYRQETLVHEARHSDCTGGITEADVQSVREMKSSREFTTTFKRPTCGHMHTYCPPGHDFAGIAACDRTPWGAYTVGAIYSTAVAKRLTGLDRAVIDASAVDQWARVLVDKEAMMTGKFGPPDMTSAGLQ